MQPLDGHQMYRSTCRHRMLGGVAAIVVLMILLAGMTQPTHAQAGPASRSVAASQTTCREAGNFNKWAYWPGHPGLLIPLTNDITR